MRGVRPQVVGAVSALRRFPVKSMQGELLDTALVGARGLLGDRAFAVLDCTTGQVVAGKTPELGTRLLACRASFEAPPEAGRALPPLAIELPDGTTVRSDAVDRDDVLEAYFGTPVTVVSQAPAESALPAMRREWLDRVGMGEHYVEGALLDLLPVSVLTSSTLERLRAARAGSDFDERRFRMNVVIATSGDGFLENDWPGRVLELGEVRLGAAFPVPRCAITTMAQEDLPRDPAVLRTAARENSLELGDRTYPCVGVYATVQAAGEIRLGDAVAVT